MSLLTEKRILLIISGGIAAYKSLELIRLLKKDGAKIVPVITASGQQFVTPLSAAALAENTVYTDLWSLKDETEMGHIRLSRESDIILVAPATANIMAKMANGIADDLATTLLLASDKPVMIAPAMNPKMWAKPSTQRNLLTLRQDGIHFIGPCSGEMACGETGLGRMAEPAEILTAITQFFSAHKPLHGRKALVTSGPTYEPIDPVRFIGNRSSGKQGHAIASALTAQGADVTLVTGPVALSDPIGIHTIHVETAQQMFDAAMASLPADIAICAAAVADWAPQTPQSHKMKKRAGESAPTITLQQNPDILAAIGNHAHRPALVIGFAAETEDAVTYARKKMLEKNCDWIIANIVGKADAPVFGEDTNTVTLVTRSQTEDWAKMDKSAIAAQIANRISEYFLTKGQNDHDHHCRTASSTGK